MTDEMMAAMATDLNIRQFVNENQPQFINRLLYSGVSGQNRFFSLRQTMIPYK